MVGWHRTDTLIYPALVCSSSLAPLLFCVLAQQGTHLLLVIKRTGTESGLQPSAELGMRGQINSQSHLMPLSPENDLCTSYRQCIKTTSYVQFTL